MIINKTAVLIKLWSCVSCFVDPSENTETDCISSRAVVFLHTFVSITSCATTKWYWNAWYAPADSGHGFIMGCKRLDTFWLAQSIPGIARRKQTQISWMWYELLSILESHPWRAAYFSRCNKTLYSIQALSFICHGIIFAGRGFVENSFKEISVSLGILIASPKLPLLSFFLFCQW